MNTSFGIAKYRSVKLILDKIEISQRESLTKFRDRISENLVRAESRSRKADLGSRSIAEAARSTTRLSELDPLEEFDKKDRLISHAMGGDSNFIHIYANISQGLKLAWNTINSISSTRMPNNMEMIVRIRVIRAPRKKAGETSYSSVFSRIFIVWKWN